MKRLAIGAALLALALPAAAGEYNKRLNVGDPAPAWTNLPGTDGKARVWRGLRLRMYRTIAAQLRAAFGSAPLYLCMEPAAVWERVMHEVPTDRQLGLRLAAGATW